MSASLFDAVRVQLKARQHDAERDLAGERARDAATAKRIYAETPAVLAALAYDHASHGCPNGWPDAPCPICDENDAEALWI